MNNVDLLLQKAPHETHSFINYVVDFCVNNKIDINVANDKFVLLLGSECAGSFSAATKILSIAIDKDFNDWFPVLVHEFCHATQYADDPEGFSNLDLSSDAIFHWTSGKEYSNEDLDKFFNDTINLESDCESRVCKSISNYNLFSFINLEEYAQKGNAYAQFYQYFRETRKWYVSGKEPYLLKEVWQLFPTTVHVGKMDLTYEQKIAFENCTKE